ncbi:MAG: flavin reductase [Clostridiales bacterium]|jgi:flavin reductase (DIM6/NTAB) family NADH-FMN oxidoreductase RutF|nr:flavin reductase [Clostridiales bacterium]
MTDLTKYSQKIINNFEKRGAFLISKLNEKINVMTIGWGNLGIEWRKYIFIIMVRESRYTKEIIDASNEFTITIPLDEKMDENLKICGKDSGRDYDKINTLNLETVKSKKNNTPLISCKSISLECTVVYKQKINIENLDNSKKEAFYFDEDLHTFYHGEILYINENL